MRSNNTRFDNKNLSDIFKTDMIFVVVVDHQRMLPHPQLAVRSNGVASRNVSEEAISLYKRSTQTSQHYANCHHVYCKNIHVA